MLQTTSTRDKYRFSISRAVLWCTSLKRGTQRTEVEVDMLNQIIFFLVEEKSEENGQARLP
jgi:hypothetical protein